MKHHSSTSPPAKATLRQIAQQAGVSISTASRILNGRRGEHSFTAETCQRVEALARKLNYLPRESSKDPAPRRSIAYLYSNRFGDPAANKPDDSDVLRGVEFITNMLVGVQQAAATYGFQFSMVSGLNQPDTQLDYLASARKQQVDGLMLSGLIHPQAIAYLQEHRIPAIYVGDAAPPVGQLSCIQSDNFTGGVLATRHLLSRGHQRIAFVGDYLTDHMEFNRARMAGYLEALIEAGIDPDPRLFVSAEDDEGMLIEMQRLGSLKNPPTAAFTATQWTGVTLLNVAEKLQWPVPRKLSVVAFDNTSISDYTRPPLTTINVPRVMLGRQAARRLLELIDNPDLPPLTTLVPVNLVQRESVGPGPFAGSAAESQSSNAKSR